MTKPGLTLIAMVLDKSGSMEVIRDDTIGAVNAFLDDQEKVPGEALVSLTLFDTEFDKRHEAVPIGDVPRLTEETYVPSGMTALWDAVGTTIDSVGKRLADLAEADRPEKVVFVVQTDGHENSSREYSANQVREAILRQQEMYDWQFLFLGAGQDAWVAGAQMGLARDQTMSYDPLQQAAAYMASSAHVSAYRTGARSSTKLDMDEQDIREQK